MIQELEKLLRSERLTSHDKELIKQIIVELTIVYESLYSQYKVINNSFYSK